MIASPTELQVNIRSVDEAIVIGAALSLSSSAFVLQVLVLDLFCRDLTTLTFIHIHNLKFLPHTHNN